MRKLIDIIDESARQEIGDYYIVAKSSLDNILSIFEGGVKRIAELTAIINTQQEDIEKLTKQLLNAGIAEK
jgi:hypothetical protein